MTSSIEEIVYHELSTSILVTAQVSTRIAPEYRPSEFALPCISYEVASMTSLDSLSGRGETLTGDVAISVMSRTVEAANLVGEAVRLALDSTTGTLDGTTYSFRFTDVDTDYAPPIDGGDDGFGVYTKTMNFNFYKDSGGL